MNQEKFKVIQFTRDFIICTDKQLENFPRRHFEIKEKIRNYSYDMLEKMYEANLVRDNNRKLILLEEVCARLKTIDFLINLSYDKELITGKKYLKLGERMSDITIYLNGWIKMTLEAIEKEKKIKK